MKRFKKKSIAIICLLILLHLTIGNLAFAITNGGYGGTTISGRPSIAIVPGGAGGTLVNTYNGNLFLPRSDLVIPGRGLPIEIKLTYNSNDDDVDGPFGFGWRFSYGMGYILQSDNDVVIIWGDGRTDLFDESGGTYTPVNEGVFATLEQYQPNKFRLTTKQQIQFFFDDPIHRRLTKTQDPNGNTLTFTYNASRQLTTITDASGRNIFLSYTNGRVTTITDPNTSPVRTLRYGYDANGNQISSTDPLGNTTTYAYDSGHHMTHITDPRGFTTNISYTSLDIAVASISTSLSQRLFSYDKATKTTTVTDDIDGSAIAVTKYIYMPIIALPGLLTPWAVWKPEPMMPLGMLQALPMRMGVPLSLPMTQKGTY